MKILITGGHLTPALAVIEKLQVQPQIEIIFVGRKYAVESENTLSWEYKEIEKRGIKFIPLYTGRLTRFVSFRNIRSILKIPLGFFQAFKIVRSEKPDIILSFGGYLALPIALTAFLFGKPIFTHEQTIHPGFANRIIGFFAKKVFVAFEDAQKYFNPAKVIITGNPIRTSLFQIQKKPFDIKKVKPVIYITGGSLGSHSINVHIKAVLHALLQKYILIHQTGNVKEYHDFEDLQKIKERLPLKFKNNYYLREHFFDEEIGYIYNVADIVISRAGANTFFELLYLKKPAIFIPLPWSAHGEQQKHALIFKENQIGEIFDQSEPSAKLLEKTDEVIRQLNFYQKNFNKLKLYNRKNATDIIIEKILAEKI